VVAAAAPGRNGNDLNCPLCEYLVAMVKEQLEDKATETELLAKAAEVTILPPPPSPLGHPGEHPFPVPLTGLCQLAGQEEPVPNWA